MEFEKFRIERENRIKIAESKIKSYFKGLFDVNPSLILVTWNQYIPIFNDGDVCTFTIDTPYFCDTRLDVEDCERYHFNGEALFSRWDSDVYGNSDYNYMVECDDFLKYNEDLLQLVFGINTTLTVYPDKIIIEQYESEY